MSVRILLVDDHAPTRGLMGELLAAQPGFEVVGEADSGEAGVALAGDLTPDVVVMDVMLPGLSGAEATRRILSSWPQIRVVALSLHTARGYRDEMKKAGAVAFVTKDAAFEELPAAVGRVAERG